MTESEAEGEVEDSHLHSHGGETPGRNTDVVNASVMLSVAEAEVDL